MENTEFNQHAADYAKFRPIYPIEIFEFLKQVSPSNDLAYDVGTGNGQCAVTLANYFCNVLASDLSKEQIANSVPKKNVRYFVSEAHESNIQAESVDLITVATAIHWFNFDKFYSESKRILKKEGVIAVWSYGWHECENQQISNMIQKIGKEILKDFWSPQPKLIWDEYKTIPFPFVEMNHPKFNQTLYWDRNEFIGYLTTWSATQKYIQAKEEHPVKSIYTELTEIWKDPQSKLKFNGPIYMRLGRNL